MLFCHVTSQVPGDKHPNLLSEKKGMGFPHIVALDASGHLLETLQGSRNVQGFTSLMERAAARATELTDLKQKAEAGDPEARRQYLFAMLRLGNLQLDEAETLAQGLDLNPADRTQLETGLANLEVSRRVGELQGSTREQQLEAGRRFAEMARRGRIPGEADLQQPFWVLILDHAEAVEEVPLFELALARLEERYGANPRTRDFFARRREALEKLRAKLSPQPSPQAPPQAPSQAPSQAPGGAPGPKGGSEGS